MRRPAVIRRRNMVIAALAMLLLPACSAARRPLQVDPCLVPDQDAKDLAEPNWFSLHLGARYVAPLMESDIVARYQRATTGAAEDPAGEVRKAVRNDLIEEALTRCDAVCAAHKNAFTSESIFTNLLLSISSIGLSAAGGLASHGAANALSAASAATQGTEKAITKEVFADKVAPAVAASIDADQAKRLTLIREHEAKSDVSDYPLWAGLRDVQQYNESCSLSNGLVLLQQDATETKQKAQDDQKKAEQALMTGKFQKDSAGDALRTFWKPDGHTIDKANEKAIKDWLQAHDLKIDVTMLMRSDVLADTRAQAAKELIVSPKEGTNAPTP